LIFVVFAVTSSRHFAPACATASPGSATASIRTLAHPRSVALIVAIERPPLGFADNRTVISPPPPNQINARTRNQSRGGLAATRALILAVNGFPHRPSAVVPQLSSIISLAGTTAAMVTYLHRGTVNTRMFYSIPTCPSISPRWHRCAAVAPAKILRIPRDFEDSRASPAADWPCCPPCSTSGLLECSVLEPGCALGRQHHPAGAAFP
jgi:hypothetical protein